MEREEKTSYVKGHVLHHFGLCWLVKHLVTLSVLMFFSESTFRFRFFQSIRPILKLKFSFVVPYPWELQQCTFVNDVPIVGVKQTTVLPVKNVECAVIKDFEK